MKPVTRVRLAIIGSGPAGYTAAIYAARAELEPVVIAGAAFGGQLMITTEVENYPGFPESVAGPELVELFQKQAERFGAKIRFEDAIAIEFGSQPFAVETEAERFEADAVVVATGAQAKWLGIPSEQEYVNRGVSACATCDGALYRGRAMAVVGGGDTAMEEALFLTRFASQVQVIHRRGDLRASMIMRERARHHEKIRFVWHSEVAEVLGDGKALTGVRVRDVRTGVETQLDVGALFVAIGHRPNTDLFRGVLDRNPQGYLLTQPGTTRTNVPGVFACGDAMDPIYRQAVTAAGTGCMAALDAERWLAANE
jgi:thioredoxin reductase (NADPH)